MNSGAIEIAPIALEHAAGFHACLVGVYYDAVQMSLLLDP
jgi:hypothetical protein